MKTKVAVIGAGIVGASAAYYLSKDESLELTVFDEGLGQGTKASAGIISPWLSRRRNKKWYRMVRDAAAFYPDFLNEVTEGAGIPKSVYHQVGTLLFKSKAEYLDEMLEIGLKRREQAPEIGELSILSPEEIREKCPIYDQDASAVWASGGAKVDGGNLVDLLMTAVEANGGKLVKEKAELKKAEAGYSVSSSSYQAVFDKVILANAAWLPQSLEPLGYTVDIRPQKGQLAELSLDQDTFNWPVIMPEGESDIIPFDEGKVMIGASHEDDMGYNLDLDKEIVHKMIDSAQSVFSEKLSTDKVVNYRIGTRAYTSDYAPFFGHVPQMPGVVAASGLGSTGLTAGPLVGKILYELIADLEPSLPLSDYPIDQYVKPVTD